MQDLRDSDPRSVGPYRILARIGSGGMGEVFLGRSPGQRAVAVKVIRADLADDASFRREFEKEVAAARRVGGHFTAQVIDADTSVDRPWLATTYVPGPTLEELVVASGPLSAAQTRVLGANLAEALQAIHAADLVHRDLKPANVLLAEDGPRVIDFGIVRALDVTSSSMSRTIRGTAAYMAPEQAAGQLVGPSADVFALGSVLAFAATGNTLFGEGPPVSVMYRVVHEEPSMNGVPAGLDEVVAACLDKDSARRPTPSELVDLLGALDTGAEHVGVGRVWPPSAVTEAVAARTLRLEQLVDEGATDVIEVAPLKETLRLGDREPTAGQAGAGTPGTTPGAAPSSGAEISGAKISGGRGGGVAVLVLLLLAIGGVAYGVMNEAGAFDAGSAATEDPVSAEDPVSTDEPPSTDEPLWTDDPIDDDSGSGGDTGGWSDDGDSAETDVPEPEDTLTPAQVGDCVIDTSDNPDDPELIVTDCGPSMDKVVDRLEGTTETGGCGDVSSTYWETSGSESVVLCLDYQYSSDIYNAEPGACANGGPDGAGWAVTRCTDQVFEILGVYPGTDSASACTDDYRIVMGMTAPDDGHQAAVCLGFRYGDDRGRLPVDSCVRVTETALFIPEDCSSATHYVTGSKSGSYDPSFCGNDGYIGWSGSDPAWEKYLDFTLCFRWI